VEDTQKAPKRLWKTLTIFTVIILICILGIGFLTQTKSQIQSPKPLSQQPEVTISATESSTPSVKGSKTVGISPTEVPLKKSSFTIALFGDSMFDTMGEKAEPLQQVLSLRYPKTTFTLYNYGVGAQNIEQGLARLNASFTNKTRSYPPLSQIKPDIIIVGSFSYNVLDPHDAAKHRRLLKELVTQIKAFPSDVYLLAEIAPLETGFGKGEFGINVSDDVARTYTTKIIEQLDSVAQVASETQTPLINAYTLSQVNGKYGEPAYVTAHDGIHPSTAGHIFTSRIIARAILPSLTK